jgi:hypothetical protein
VEKGTETSASCRIERRFCERSTDSRRPREKQASAWGPGLLGCGSATRGLTRSHGGRADVRANNKLQRGAQDYYGGSATRDVSSRDLITRRARVQHGHIRLRGMAVGAAEDYWMVGLPRAVSIRDPITRRARVQHDQASRNGGRSSRCSSDRQLTVHRNSREMVELTMIQARKRARITKETSQ